MTENSRYTINDLRQDLATTIRKLRDGDRDMTIDKAKAIGELSQVMINSAKVEVDMARALGAKGMQHTGFIPSATATIEPAPTPTPAPAPAAPAAPRLGHQRDDSPVYGGMGRGPVGSL